MSRLDGIEREVKLKLDRFYVNIPDECVEDFVADMKEEVRSAPDLAAAIIVKYYRRMKRIALQATAQERGEQSAPEIPVYGPKPRQSSNIFEEESKGGV